MVTPSWGFLIWRVLYRGRCVYSSSNAMRWFMPTAYGPFRRLHSHWPDSNWRHKSESRNALAVFRRGSSVTGQSRRVYPCRGAEFRQSRRVPIRPGFLPCCLVCFCYAHRLRCL